VATLEAGLQAAGIALRPSKYELKTSAPHKWRNYVLNLWRRHQHKPEVGTLYTSKLLIAQDLLRQVVTEHPELRLPVTFDNWYTQPAFCRFLDQTLRLAYVGTLAADDQVLLAAGPHRLDTFDQQLQEEHRQALATGRPPVFRKLGVRYKGTKELYYSYWQTHHLDRFGKQRLVINHRQADLSDPAAFYISNKLNWHALGITRIRRHRWPVEVYHEEGKADGLAQYQVRDFQAIERHIALVAVTYSLLRAAQHDEVLLQKLQRHVQTELDRSAGAYRRNTQAHALWALALCIATALAQGQSLSDVMDPLIAAVAY
jgi:hypothetical protein